MIPRKMFFSPRISAPGEMGESVNFGKCLVKRNYIDYKLYRGIVLINLGDITRNVCIKDTKDTARDYYTGIIRIIRFTSNRK